MKPIGKKILFKPFLADAVSQAGIIVPDAYRGLSNRGEIVEVGHLATKVKKGQVAHRVKDWGDEVLIEGERHFIMYEDAILATQ